jgi:uncharacterized membrane protein
MFIVSLNLHNRNTLIWKLFFLDALPLLAKFQLSKFMKIQEKVKSIFVFLKQCGHYSSNIFSLLCLLVFLELQNMNVFFVILSSPNVLKFIVGFNIFDEKSIMS